MWEIMAMFDVDDIYSSYSMKAPKVNRKKKKVAANKNPVAPIISKKAETTKKQVQATIKQTSKTPKATAQRALQAQDRATQYISDETTVVHVSGDMYWTIIKEDAERLTDEQIYAYFYRRYGYRAYEIEIVRPKL